MKIDTKKLDLILARERKSLSDLRDGASPQTLRRIRRGEEVKPKTVGCIAFALNCRVEDLIEGEVR